MRNCTKSSVFSLLLLGGLSIICTAGSSNRSHRVCQPVSSFRKSALENCATELARRKLEIFPEDSLGRFTDFLPPQSRSIDYEMGWALSFVVMLTNIIVVVVVYCMRSCTSCMCSS